MDDERQPNPHDQRDAGGGYPETGPAGADPAGGDAGHRSGGDDRKRRTERTPATGNPHDEP